MSLMTLLSKEVQIPSLVHQEGALYQSECCEDSCMLWPQSCLWHFMGSNHLFIHFRFSLLSKGINFYSFALPVFILFQDRNSNT